MGIAPDRVRRHPTYPSTGESGGEVYDVALVGLRAAVSLPVTNMPWALTSTTRAQDGGAFWINGRIGPTGTDPQWDLFHQVAVMGQLDLDDPRYPFQYVDRCVDFAQPCAVQSGDSGGPVFRESSAEDNDGMGGFFKIADSGHWCVTPAPRVPNFGLKRGVYFIFFGFD